jgi:hypothetical protein
MVGRSWVFGVDLSGRIGLHPEAMIMMAKTSTKENVHLLSLESLIFLPPPKGRQDLPRLIL